MSNREAEEHIKLLRRASRVRLFLLGLGVVVTWGLWTMLQAGDQRTAVIDDAYDGHLSDLEKKWNIPSDTPIGYNSDTFEVIEALNKKEDMAKDPLRVVHFCNELDALRNQFYDELEGAYIVHVRVPYLQDPVQVNGLTLADCWPFVLISIASAAFVLNMRERVNAIIVAWIAYSRKDSSATQDLIIHSDFVIGTLEEDLALNKKSVVYRRPLILQPESLLVYALVGATIYLSFSFGFFQNPANSYEMESTLLDYVALIWYFLVALGSLVWLTRKRYRDTLDRYIGMPVRGRISQRLERLSGVWRRKFGRALARRKWLRKISSMSEALVSIAALGCLYLPWMNPQRVRGYRFFLSTVPNNLDDDLFYGLRVQLFFASLFVIICLVDWFVKAMLSRSSPIFLFKVRRFFGIATAILLGNLVFHFAMLQMLATELSERFLLMPPWNLLARPHPVKNSSLIWTDPSYGFWLFLTLCLMLVIVGNKPPKRLARVAP